ncbi:MAG: MotA/TolQ/ExbB proton channel family protein [Pontiellaceae bacterium]|jgi:biopolymer transport protein ExbB|nr:MotA/TolQ/ExbB proton channel family protein [Pontiellaceae bacterium]
MKNRIPWIIAIIWLVAMATGWAQEATELIAAEEVKKMTFKDMLFQGGWCMIPLAALSFWGVYLVVENTISLREKTLLRPDLLPDLVQMMAKGQTAEALAVCREKISMFTLVFGAGLERCQKRDISFDKVKESLEEATVEQMSYLMKPIDFLSIIGTTAPMVGLLGTVSGMIKAFQTMGTQGMGKPELLAANIGEALITTAAGLIIAIPAMFFFFIFKKGFGKTMATLGKNLGYLFDALQNREVPLAFQDLVGDKKTK